MSGADWIVIALILMIIGGAAFYIYRAKKSGAKCIGCPHSKNCSGNCSNCSGCSCHANKQ